VISINYINKLAVRIKVSQKLARAKIIGARSARGTRMKDRLVSGPLIREGIAPGREESLSLSLSLSPSSSGFLVAGWLWVGLDRRGFNLCATPFCSTKAVCRFSTPSPLPPGVTLDERRAIDLLEVEGTRRRTLPARSSRYARVSARVYGSVLACRTSPSVVTELSKLAVDHAPSDRGWIAPRSAQ